MIGTCDRAGIFNYQVCNIMMGVTDVSLLYSKCGVEVHLLACAHKDGEITRLDDPFVARAEGWEKR